MAGIGLGADLLTEVFDTCLFLLQNGLFLRIKPMGFFQSSIFSENSQAELPLQYLEELKDFQKWGFANRQL